jgi:catechol 2,3-dioxygenase-like lactoylglutathione lyase family enzyme
MLSHVVISVSRFEPALAFYRAVMHVLGVQARFCEPDKPWAGWHSQDGSRPLFILCQPFDGQPHHPGNGQMVALSAPDRATVDAAHAAALQAGGVCEGPPGLRPHYHADYYGAYFRDLDGNKLGVVCHAASAPADPTAAHPQTLA